MVLLSLGAGLLELRLSGKRWVVIFGQQLKWNKKTQQKTVDHHQDRLSTLALVKPVSQDGDFPML